MAAIVIKSFAGLRPALHPRLLGVSEAQVAKNAKLNNGALRVMKGGLTVSTLAFAVQSIYRYGQTNSDSQYWFQFSDDADVILSPVVQDQHKRVYWTTANSTSVRYAPESVAIGAAPYPSASYILGIPKPTSTPSAVGTAAPTYTRERREYIIVFTGPTDSGPSAATTVTAVNTKPVRLTNIPVPATGSSYTGKKLFRRDASVGGSQFRLVASLATGDTEYEDLVANASLGATYTTPSVSAVAVPGRMTATSAAITATAAAKTRYYAYTTGGHTISQNVPEGSSLEYFIAEDNLSAVASISVDETQAVTISGMSKTGNAPAQYFRVYRKDDVNGAFLLIAQVPASQTSYVDSAATAVGTPYGGASYGSVFTPAAAPTTSASGSSAVVLASVPRRIYALTYVSSGGTEGARGQESNVVMQVDGVTKVTLDLPAGAPTSVTKARIYRRTVTVTSGVISGSDADYRLLAEVPSSTLTYDDTATASSIAGNAGLPAASQGTAVAPAAGMLASAEVPDDVVANSRAYVYTYVSAYGEEGPPSEPSTTISVDPSQPVTVSGMATGPGGAYNITLKRVYRTSTSSGATAFQFVAEIPVANATYADSVKQADLGEVLSTDGYVAAGTGVGAVAATSCHPDMKGLTLAANGIAAGFVGKTAHFSESFRPHAYPAEYAQTTEFDIVGLASFGQSFAVLTKANPYIASGVDAASISMVKLPLPQACVSKRSICPMADGVLYSSPDGLVRISGGGAEIVTRGLLSRDQWQAYSPSSMLIRQYNDKVYVFHSAGLIVFDFTGESATMTTFDQTASAAYYDPIQDHLYIAVNGTGIQKWDAGTALSYTWKTKLFTLTQDKNFAYGQVEASAYPVTFKVFCDGALKHTRTVANRYPFRLPSGFRAKDWEVELTGVNEVYALTLAESAVEVQLT